MDPVSFAIFMCIQRRHSDKKCADMSMFDGLLLIEHPIYGSLEEIEDSFILAK